MSVLRSPRPMGRLAAAMSFMVVALLVPMTATAAPASKPLATFTIDRSDPNNPVYAHAWVVPKGIKRVTFHVFGATGGGSFGGPGGEAQATYRVSAGQVFQVVVGGTTATWRGGLNGGGGGSLDGGFGGGGASDVRICANAAFQLCSLYDRFLVAGGGGGAWDGSAETAGGGGGGLQGNLGSGTEPGGGGSQDGAGCSLDSCDFEGAFGVGGDTGFGGGGGGGWYGGGGGGAGSGGGGGSGHLEPAISAATHNGVWSGGDGMVIIYKAS